MQKPAPPKLPKPQPQHPHLKTTPKRRHGRPAPSPSRTPRVGTAALAAHAGPGLHSPAGAGTHREGPCRSRRVTSRIARKLLPRPTHQKAPARGGSRCKGSGERKPPPPGAFSTSRIPLLAHSPFAVFQLTLLKHGSVTKKTLPTKGPLLSPADSPSVFTLPETQRAPTGAGSLLARGFGEANRARHGLSGKGCPTPGGKGAGLVELVEQVHGSTHGVEGHAQGHGAYDGQRYGHGAP